MSLVEKAVNDLTDEQHLQIETASLRCEIAHPILQKMGEMKISIEKMADMIDVDYFTIKDMLTGDTQMDFDILGKIARIIPFEITINFDVNVS